MRHMNIPNLAPFRSLRQNIRKELNNLLKMNFLIQNLRDPSFKFQTPEKFFHILTATLDSLFGDIGMGTNVDSISYVSETEVDSCAGYFGSEIEFGFDFERAFVYG